MIAGVEIENGSCDPDHALLGWFVIQKLGFDTVYLYFIHHKMQ